MNSIDYVNYITGHSTIGALERVLSCCVQCFNSVYMYYLVRYIY